MRAQWGGSAGIASVVVGCGVEGNAAELGLGGLLGLELPYGPPVSPRCRPGAAARSARRCRICLAATRVRHLVRLCARIRPSLFSTKKPKGPQLPASLF